jgi:hypothetical protein
MSLHALVFIKIVIGIFVYSSRSVVLNYLKPKLAEILFKNSVRTSKKTQHFTITKINWLTLFKEIIAVYTEKYTNTRNAK